MLMYNVSQVLLQGRVFTRGRTANTVEVHAPVLPSINVANADYDTVSSQTDSSDSMLSDYLNLYDPPPARIEVSSSLSSKRKNNLFVFYTFTFICLSQIQRLVWLQN